MEHQLVRKIGLPCRRGTPLPMYTLIEGQTLQVPADTGRVDRKSGGGARPVVICILAPHCFSVKIINTFSTRQQCGIIYSATIINITRAQRDRMWLPDRKSDGARPEVICIINFYTKTM